VFEKGALRLIVDLNWKVESFADHGSRNGRKRQTENCLYLVHKHGIEKSFLPAQV